ncbi:MAG: glycosyltransferase, partial [Deltaproteobacteria bacterium]|nr:glycosyltransferase [Deltaproteobacteria bacterium]
MRRLRVLYVTDRDDAPFRYRVLGPVRELRASGALANIVRLDDPTAPGAVAAYDVVVLFRLAWDASVAQVVAAARAAAVPLVFDIDDLLFDVDAAERLPFRGMLAPSEWEARYASLIPRLRRTFDAANAFLGSTQTLVEHAARLGKPARLHPNLLPREIERLGRVQGALVRALRGPPTLGYFSGSDTHDEDLASVADALGDVLDERPDARLLAVGHLALGARHARLRGRVVVVPYLDPRVFGALYAACHAVIAPLAHRGPFVDAKSPLKFFEPGALGVPVVASPARELAAAIRHGETGWLADSPAEFRDALREALDAPRA